MKAREEKKLSYAELLDLSVSSVIGLKDFVQKAKLY